MAFFLRMAFWAAWALATAKAERKVSWWLGVADNATVDGMNAQAIRDHRHVFSRVMPCMNGITLDGNVSNWWGHDADVQAWNAPLQAMGVPVLPYLIDVRNSTQMHLVYANTSAVVADAVAVAKHYGFQGWFIDYEDEHPPDTDPHKSAKLAAFLTELGDALHAQTPRMNLTICVAMWSKLLSDYQTLAASTGVDELQYMSTYDRPHQYPKQYQDWLASYFEQVRRALLGTRDSHSQELARSPLPCMPCTVLMYRAHCLLS
jgi:hypothetical protein